MGFNGIPSEPEQSWISFSTTSIIKTEWTCDSLFVFGMKDDERQRLDTPHECVKGKKYFENDNSFWAFMKIADDEKWEFTCVH